MKMNVSKRPLIIDNVPSKKYDWYSWDEFCDKCGQPIFQVLELEFSKPPKMDEIDLCSNCLEEGE